MQMRNPQSHAARPSQVGAMAAAYRRGFTIVELLAAMSIVGVASVATTAVAVSAVATLRDASVSWSLHQDAAAALDRMSLDLRGLAQNSSTQGPDVTSISGNAIITATGLTYRFIDASASAPGRIEVIESSSSGPVTLVASATSMSIVVQDGAGAVLTLPMTSAAAASSVRRIVITLSVARAGVTETLRTTVTIRSCL